MGDRDGLDQMNVAISTATMGLTRVVSGGRLGAQRRVVPGMRSAISASGCWGYRALPPLSKSRLRDHSLEGAGWALLIGARQLIRRCSTA